MAMSSLRCCCRCSKLAIAKKYQISEPRASLTTVNPYAEPKNSIIFA